ncbi:MAG: hypothetical protein K8R36_02025 [Planctomycetales bacterium]|nr:hypothetical protein [Planctomycetales bacterium]
MSDYAIIFQILGVLCALFFIFLTVMNFKTWRWLHALTTFAVFCAVVTFMVYASLVMKTRLAWIQSVSKFAEANEKQASNVEKIVNGSVGDQATIETSLAHYRSELARALVDRGRVWRSCTPANNADGTVTLTMNLGAAPAAPPVDPAAPPAAAPAAPAAAPVAKKHELKAQDIVFAFKEVATPEGSLPAYFVGEFQVTAVTETTVSLKLNPTYLRGPVQANEADGPWMLYEVLPPDGHEPFAFQKDVPKAQRIDSLTKIGIPPAAAESYARDNGPGDVNDPKDNTWVQVKFTKAHEIIVDASAMVSPVEEKHFDAQGQSQIPRLLRTKDPKTPEPVKFVANDIAIFDQATADDLVNRGIAQRQGLIYRRKLNDYEQAFQVISRKLYVLRDKTAVVVRDTATIKNAREKAVEQTMLLEATKALLQADYDKVVYERDEMKKYADAVAARIKEKRAEMSRLYLRNKELYAQLVELDRKMNEEVERRQRLSAVLPEVKK